MKSPVKYLALVESPLQLENVIKAFSFLEIPLDQVILLIRLNDASIFESYDFKLKKFNRVKKFFAKKENKIELFFGVLRKIELIVNFRYEYCIIGDYRSSWMRFFARLVSLKHLKRHIYVDDGAATIMMAHKMNTGDLCLPENSMLLTNYPVNCPRDMKLMLMPTRKITKQLSNTGIILGAPFVEAEIFSRNEYIKYLGLIMSSSAQFGVSDFVYCPHRRESDLNIKVYLNLFNFSVENKNTPVESMFKVKGVIPRHVFGFYSTALINLHSSFFGLNVVAFKPSNLPAELEGAHIIYSFLAENTGISVEVLYE